MASMGGSRRAMADLSGRIVCRVGAHAMNRETTTTDAAASGYAFPRILIAPAFLHTYHCTPRYGGNENTPTDFPWKVVPWIRWHAPGLSREKGFSPSRCYGRPK